jgi:hypothetical protein
VNPAHHIRPITSTVTKETHCMASHIRYVKDLHMPRRVVFSAVICLAVVIGMVLPGLSSAAGPELTVTITHNPSTFQRGDIGDGFGLTLANTGDAPTSGAITLNGTLSAGLKFRNAISPDLATLTTNSVIAPGDSLSMGSVGVVTAIDAPDPATLTVTISGGGAPDATYSGTAPIVDRPPFEATDFTARALDEFDGDYTVAGGHPDTGITEFRFPSYPTPGGASPVQDVKDIFVDLPPGFVGNVAATPRCKLTDLQPLIPTCPPAAKIGILYLGILGNPAVPQTLYNVVPEKGYPAAFAFAAFSQTIVTYVRLRPRTDGYRVTVVSPGASRLSITSLGVRLFGVPSVDNGSGGAPIPFLTNPVDCQESHPQTTLTVDSWQHSARQLPGADFGFPDPTDPLWKTSSFPAPPVTGCDDPALTSQFDPTLVARPVQAGPTIQADQPAGLRVDLDFPQSNDPTDPEYIADPSKFDPSIPQAPELKDATVKLPAGFSVSPSSADGLAGCSDLASDPAGDQVRYDDTDPVSCPDASKIGAVTATSPLLASHHPITDAVTGAEPIHGDLYLLKPHPGDLPVGGGPQDGKFRLLIQLESERYGINVKLPGIATADKQTGQLTTTFLQNPQLPAKHLTIELNSGSRASLATPVTCGKFTTTSDLVPWSTPGTPDATPSSSFEVNSGPGGTACAATPQQRPFSPALSAGTENAKAGASSPFVFKLSRKDGEQEFSSLDVNLPKGFTAKLAGIPYCSEAAIAAAASRSGAAEKANPTCPGSQVGTLTTGAGPGPSPYYVNGRAYLAGPYKGAPLSFAFITPAVAGPFDLGNVVVRAAAYVDPETAQVTVRTDPIPQILDGVPLRIRSIVARVDRPSFTLNPTSCEAKSISATVGGSSGASATPSAHFQVGDCGSLKFKPTLSLRLKGETKRSGNPALTAVLKAPAGQANIASTTVLLPATEFIDNAHINNPCTRVQFNAGACPPSSVLGTATAHTPLLDQPLTGPVYFRANGGERDLPDIVADLGGQIHVTLVGFVDSVPIKGTEKSRVRTRFLNVPDAPVSKFVLKMKGGRKGLIENSQNLCKHPGAATVRMGAQNGRANDFQAPLKTSCGKKNSKKHRRSGG